MFKIYDLNMKEIPFPDGVMPLEIFVGSVGKNRTTDTVDGRAGVVDYGFNYTDRPVSLFLRIKATDKIDFRLLRNEVFATFDVGSAFYVAESDVPSRVLKVVVDESYIPDRLTEEYADFDINCRTLDSVFWESKYTTLELHDSGYSAIAEKYGLVDNIDVEKVKYRFTPDIISRDLSNTTFAYGLISGTGAITASQGYSYSVNFIKLTPGLEYTFEDKGTNPRLSYWWFAVYDDDGEFIERFSSSSNSNPRLHKFVAKGSNLRLMTNAITPLVDNVIRPEEIGVDVLPTISSKAEETSFTVYNAGNVTVEPESMYINIDMKYVTTSGGFKIRNNTTGEEHIINSEHNRRNLHLKGMKVLSGSNNNFRNTNRRFISLAPGDNLFSVTGGTFESIDFDFKYYYK